MKIMIYLYLNAEDKEQKVGVSEIAKGIGSPKPFTSKVLQRLTKSKMIKSTPGPGGGYYLPEGSDYTLTEIMEAINEAHFLTACILGFEKCSSENPCAVHHQYNAARQDINSLFNETTISQVSISVRKGDTSLLD